MTAFPQYTHTDLESMRRDEYAYLFALAEWSIVTLRGIPLVLGPAQDQLDPRQGMGASVRKPPPPLPR